MSSNGKSGTSAKQRKVTAKAGSKGAASAEPAQAKTNVPAPRNAGQARQLFQQRFGQLMLAMLQLPRYRALTADALTAISLQPLLDDRVAFAHRGDDADEIAPMGMAIWASVSAQVGARIAEAANKGLFPVLMGKEDWTSGDQIWLLDLIVPSRKSGSAVFGNFASLIGERGFRMHPVVLNSVDQAIIDQIKTLGDQVSGGTKPH
jgi:cytolysin-activating lysine-acyltransferase